MDTETFPTLESVMVEAFTDYYETHGSEKQMG
jgi:hypothetical protein